jgi:hypothetical protein
MKVVQPVIASNGVSSSNEISGFTEHVRNEKERRKERTKFDSRLNISCFFKRKILSRTKLRIWVSSFLSWRSN